MGVSVKRGVGVRGRDRGRGRGLSFFEKNAVLGLGFGLELVSDAVVQLADVHRSRRWHELLGGSGVCPPPPPPVKFVKLDYLKCNFLRSLDRNWVTGIMTGIISFFRLYALHQ